MISNEVRPLTTRIRPAEGEIPVQEGSDAHYPCPTISCMLCRPTSSADRRSGPRSRLARGAPPPSPDSPAPCVDRERVAILRVGSGSTSPAVGSRTKLISSPQKAVRAMGTTRGTCDGCSLSIDNAARVCHSPSTFGLKGSLGVAATTCSYSDWIGSDLVDRERPRRFYRLECGE